MAQVKRDWAEGSEEYLEKALEQREIGSLDSMDEALTSIASSLRTAKEGLYADLRKVQSEARECLKSTSLEHLRDQLHVVCSQTLHISLETGQNKAQSSSEDFSRVCIRLTQLHRAKENAAHLIQTLMQLQQLNSNDSDIDLDAERIILIRSALDELNSPAYTTVPSIQAQRLIEVKFNLKKNELIETFKSALALSDLEGLSKTYELMRQYDLDEEARHVYITKLTEPVTFKLNIEGCETCLRQGLSSVEQIFATEIVGKAQNLRLIFGSVEQVSSLYMCQVLEIKLKPFLHYCLDMDNCTQLRLLQNLYTAYKSVTEVLGRMTKAGIEAVIDIEKTAIPLYSGLFAPFLRAYFDQEVAYLKRSFEADISAFLDPIKPKQHKKMLNLIHAQEEEDLRSQIDILHTVMRGIDYQKLWMPLCEAHKRCQTLSIATELSKNTAKLLSYAYEVVFTEVFSAIYVRANSTLSAEGAKFKPHSGVFDLLSTLSAHIQDANIVFSRLLQGSKLGPEEAERHHALRKRISFQLEQQLIRSFNHTLDLLVQHCARVFASEQKKNDYVRGGAEYRDNTLACANVHEFLLNCIGTVKRVMPGKQIARFLPALSKQFLSLVVEHVSKFTVSQERALLLSSDMNKYRNVIIQCDDETTLFEFEKFRQLINLYLIPPESLAEFIQEEPITSIPVSVIIQFISRREDFKSSRIERLLSSLF